MFIVKFPSIYYCSEPEQWMTRQRIPNVKLLSYISLLKYPYPRVVIIAIYLFDKGLPLSTPC